MTQTQITTLNPIHHPDIDPNLPEIQKLRIGLSILLSSPTRPFHSVDYIEYKENVLTNEQKQELKELLNQTAEIISGLNTIFLEAAAASKNLLSSFTNFAFEDAYYLVKCPSTKSTLKTKISQFANDFILELTIVHKSLSLKLGEFIKNDWQYQKRVKLNSQYPPLPQIERDLQINYLKVRQQELCLQEWILWKNTATAIFENIFIFPPEGILQYYRLLDLANTEPNREKRQKHEANLIANLTTRFEILRDKYQEELKKDPNFFPQELIKGSKEDLEKKAKYRKKIEDVKKTLESITVFSQELDYLEYNSNKETNKLKDKILTESPFTPPQKLENEEEWKYKRRLKKWEAECPKWTLESRKAILAEALKEDYRNLPPRVGETLTSLLEEIKEDKDLNKYQELLEKYVKTIKEEREYISVPFFGALTAAGSTSLPNFTKTLKDFQNKVLEIATEKILSATIQTELRHPLAQASKTQQKDFRKLKKRLERLVDPNPSSLLSPAMNSLRRLTENQLEISRSSQAKNQNILDIISHNLSILSRNREYDRKALREFYEAERADMILQRDELARQKDEETRKLEEAKNNDIRELEERKNNEIKNLRTELDRRTNVAEDLRFQLHNLTETELESKQNETNFVLSTFQTYSSPSSSHSSYYSPSELINESEFEALNAHIKELTERIYELEDENQAMRDFREESDSEADEEELLKQRITELENQLDRAMNNTYSAAEKEKIDRKIEQDLVIQKNKEEKLKKELSEAKLETKKQITELKRKLGVTPADEWLSFFSGGYWEYTNYKARQQAKEAKYQEITKGMFACLLAFSASGVAGITNFLKSYFLGNSAMSQILDKHQARKAKEQTEDSEDIVYIEENNTLRRIS